MKWHLLVCWALVACTVAVPAAQRPVQSDQEILIDLERQWNEAFYQKDLDFIGKLLAPDFTATYEDGSRGDRDLELKLTGEFNERVESAVQDNFKVKVYGETAVVWFTLHLVGIRQGQRATVEFSYTDIWILREGRWQCVSTHSTKLTPK